MNRTLGTNSPRWAEWWSSNGRQGLTFWEGDRLVREIEFPGGISKSGTPRRERYEEMAWRWEAEGELP